MACKLGIKKVRILILYHDSDFFFNETHFPLFPLRVILIILALIVIGQYRQQAK